MAFRQRLYSILPELCDLDLDSPVIIYSETNINDIKNEYIAQLSNCASLEELINTNPSIVFSYISALEKYIVSETYPTSNVFSYITQKLSILEPAYSNLVQSSTQSSQ